MRGYCPHRTVETQREREGYYCPHRTVANSERERDTIAHTEQLQTQREREREREGYYCPHRTVANSERERDTIAHTEQLKLRERERERERERDTAHTVYYCPQGVYYCPHRTVANSEREREILLPTQSSYKHQVGGQHCPDRAVANAQGLSGTVYTVYYPQRALHSVPLTIFWSARFIYVLTNCLYCLCKRGVVVL